MLIKVVSNLAKLYYNRNTNFRSDLKMIKNKGLISLIKIKEKDVVVESKRVSGRDDEFLMYALATLNQMVIENKRKDLGIIRIKNFGNEANPPVVVCCFCGCF